jgi:hypothetical protein
VTSAAASSAEHLWRHEDPGVFHDTMRAAAGQLDVQPLAVEKDYWVCQALRAVATAFPGQVIFKGGTSLEKLRLIQRFSEDLDLLVVADFPNVRQGKKALQRMLAAAAEAVDSQLGPNEGGGSLGGQHRRAYVTPPLIQTGSAAPGLADPGRVLVELGQSGGRHPSDPTTVTSLLTRQLQTTTFNVAAYDDLRPFDVPVLHPGRTLLEKLLRVNNFSVDDGARASEHGWPRIGRQFYDIWALLGDERTLALLADKELAREVLADCYTISEMFQGDRPAPDGGFSRCGAFAGDGPLAPRLREHHELAMETLYYGALPGPTFDEVLERIHASADLLDVSPTGDKPT